jgi:hypothetical protein
MLQSCGKLIGKVTVLPYDNGTNRNGHFRVLLVGRLVSNAAARSSSVYF